MTPTCFDALDRHVIAGAADRPALVHGATSWSYARLLEEVAAFGGVLRHCGVSAGQRVDVLLPDSPEAVVAVLACGRLGAEHSFAGGGAQVLVTDSTVDVEVGVAEVVLVKQRDGAARELREGRDYDWDVVMRAGRTDPAPCLEGAVITPYDDRTAALVGALLEGGTVELAD